MDNLKGSNYLNPGEIAEGILNACNKKYASLEKFNIMVMGKTGSGKSTLINALFLEDVAQTGTGKPITQEISKYEDRDYPLAIYDTPGLELRGDNSYQKMVEEAKSIVKKGVDSGSIGDAIHCVLYCVSALSHRFEQAEVDFIKLFIDETAGYNVPVFIVLTQSYDDDDDDVKALQSAIRKENLRVEGIIPVLAHEKKIGGQVFPPHGVDNLIWAISNVLPESVNKTFISIQKANLELKQKKVREIITAAGVAAAATGAIPIPFSDAAILVPDEITMLASISVVYGLRIDKGILYTLLSATLGTSGATILGKTVVSNILKLIPGAGSVVGGLISASTAAALTVALGEAYSKILTQVCKGEIKASDLSTNVGKEKFREMFAEELKVKRDKEGNPVKN